MYLLFFFLDFSSLFSFSVSSALCFLIWYFIIASIKRYLSYKYNPTSWLNVLCMKLNNIWSRFIASSFRTSMSYLSQLRSILYCSNNSSFFSILMHGSWIPNVFILFRWRSNTFFLIHFRKLVWILNMCNIQKTFSLPAADLMTIVFFQLWQKKHWVIVWASIYNWNCNKASLSKRGRRGMINVREDELWLSSFLHWKYICMKKSMYSRSIRNLLISIVIVFNQLG